MFKFPIRDLIWLTLVVGVGLGWFQETIARKREAIRSLAREGAWTIAVGALPIKEQEETRERLDHAFKSLYPKAARAEDSN